MRRLLVDSRLSMDSSTLPRVLLESSRGALLQTLFGIYIDEPEDFLWQHTHVGDGCMLHHVFIAMLPFVDDVVLYSFF
jgi:hypothetical protein